MSASPSLPSISLPSNGYQFTNYQNNCYMNAVHQVLFLIPELLQWVHAISSRLQAGGESCSKRIAVTCLFELMRAPNRTRLLSQTRNYVCSFFQWNHRAQYKLGNQADSHEYFLDLFKLLEKVGSSLKLERDSNLFSLNEATYCSCLECQRRTWQVCDPVDSLCLCPPFHDMSSADNSASETPHKILLTKAVSLQTLVDNAFDSSGDVIVSKCQCGVTRDDNTKNYLLFGAAPRYLMVFLRRTIAGEASLEKNIFPVFAPETLRIPFEIGDTSGLGTLAVLAKGSLNAAKLAIQGANKLLQKEVRPRKKLSVAFKKAFKNASKSLSLAQKALDAESNHLNSSDIQDPTGLEFFVKATQDAVRRALRRTRKALDDRPELEDARSRASSASATRQTRNRSFSLRATVNHTGTAVAGHYIARILAKEGWLECDDLKSGATPLKKFPSLKKDYSTIQPNTTSK